MIKRLVAICAGIMLGTAFVTAVWLVWASFFDDRKPLYVSYTHPVPSSRSAKSRAELIDMPVVRPGEVFYTYREFCVKHRYRVLRNQRRLVDIDGDRSKDITFPIIPTRIVRKVGDCVNQTFDNELPISARPGVYLFVADWDYTLDDNPIKTFFWEWDVISIIVVAADPDKDKGARGERGPAGERGPKGDSWSGK